MPSKLLFDLSRLDQRRIELSREEIRQFNPQRYEFEQLDGIFRILPSESLIVGYRDVRSDEFWVRGHFPGRPILPGVLMVEAAAQLSNLYYARSFPPPGFLGFGGLDRVKFRASVRPGERLILVAKAVRLHPRHSIFETQGLVGDRLVFEAAITGIVLPDPEETQALHP